MNTDVHGVKQPSVIELVYLRFRVLSMPSSAPPLSFLLIILSLLGFFFEQICNGEWMSKEVRGAARY